jgi:hypothetical protein
MNSTPGPFESLLAFLHMSVAPQIRFHTLNGSGRVAKRSGHAYLGCKVASATIKPGNVDAVVKEKSQSGSADVPNSHGLKLRLLGNSQGARNIIILSADPGGRR